MHRDKAAPPFYARTVLQDGRVLPTLPPCACASCAGHAVAEESASEELCDAIRRCVRELLQTDPATWLDGPPTAPLDDEGAGGSRAIPTGEQAVPECDGRLLMAAPGRGVPPSDTRPTATRVDVPGHQDVVAHPEPDRGDVAASERDQAPSAAVKVTDARQVGASVAERVPTLSPRTLPGTPPVEAAFPPAAANDRSRTAERIARIAAAEEGWYKSAIDGDVRVAQKTSSSAAKAVGLSVAVEGDAANKLGSARETYEHATRRRRSAQAAYLAREEALSPATARTQELQVTVAHVTEDIKAAESRLQAAMTALDETMSSSSALAERQETEAAVLEGDAEDLSSRLGSMRLRIVSLRSAVEGRPLPALPESKPLDDTTEDQGDRPPSARHDGEEPRTGTSPPRKRRKQVQEGTLDNMEPTPKRE